MVAYIPFIRARLSVSALFSIAVHALILLVMAGFALFPDTLSKTTRPLDLVLVTSASDDEDNTSAQAQQLSRAVHTQGNAQWTVRPGIQDESKSSRRRTISAASHQARDADYLARWRARVEQFGTRYYQQKIKTQPVSGELRILVSIGTNGELLGAQIRQSSGQQALDQLALDILKKVAPFEPLPAEIRTDTEVLEIIRTWKFTAKEGLRAG
jgi:TonB family protein